MSKHFRPWRIDETQLLPPSVADYVPEGHLSRFIVAVVRESLDLKEINASYASGVGQPPFDPRMMTALLLHGYASGVYSSRRIARAAQERADFMMIAALDPPDFRTVSDFRKRHLKALAGLFVQVLKLAEKAGLVKLGHVALDGTKIKANASKHKASCRRRASGTMSYARMKTREAELKAEVDRWLAAAEASDAEEDQAFGADKRGMLEACLRHDEMPDWVADKERRLAKIREAKAALEAEAQAAAEEEARAEAEAEEQRQAEGKKKPGKKTQPPSPEPDAKAQRNFSPGLDPGSREPHSQDERWLHPGLERASGRRWRGADHRGARADPKHERPRPARRARRRRRREPRAPPQGGFRRRGLPLGSQPRGAQGTRDRRLHRDRAGQASGGRRSRGGRAADAGHAAKAQAGRMAKPLPIKEADCGAGVRTDQTGERFPAVPVARPRKSKSRMGDDLHGPQPRQARERGVRTAPSMKPTGHMPIWTGS